MKQGTFIKAFVESMISFFILSAVIVLFSIYIKDEAILSIVSYAVILPFFILKNLKYIKKCVKDFKFNKDTIINILLISALFIVLADFLNQTLEFLTNTSATNDALVQAQLKKTPIVILRTALLGPIIEEFIFRVPYQGLKKKKLAIFIFYSVIFAASHVIVVDSLINYIYFFPYLLLSFGIGYSFYKTDNILLSMIVHILNNLIEIMLLFI